MESMNDHLAKICRPSTYAYIVSHPRQKGAGYKRIEIHKVGEGYQVEQYSETQVFHGQLSGDEVQAYLFDALSGTHRNLHAWDGVDEYEIMVSKKGKVFFGRRKSAPNAPKPRTSHDRKKSAYLPEDTFIFPLYDMGVITKEGKIVTGMYSKFRQLNRFIEVIDDALKAQSVPEKALNIIDFGCGKSYLTFVLYYYLTQVKGYQVRLVGLDLKEDVIIHCNEVAQKYGYDTLTFQKGDIAGFHYEGRPDMVITLHACDTATDYALYNAMKWKARMIFSVPCCQHELNAQIAPKQLEILARYGIIKERFCALATDAIRANLLESRGYRTQLLEFIDIEHTPKNIMIRAVQSANERKDANALHEAKGLMEAFGFEPTLYRLLQDG